MSNNSNASRDTQPIPAVTEIRIRPFPRQQADWSAAAEREGMTIAEWFEALAARELARQAAT